MAKRAAEIHCYPAPSCGVPHNVNVTVALAQTSYNIHMKTTGLLLKMPKENNELPLWVPS